MILSTNWKNWLLNHKDNKLYEAMFDRISRWIDIEEMNPVEYFRCIEKLNILIVLTLSDKDQLVASFNHKAFGNPLLDEDLVLVYLCGFGNEAYPTSIEMDKALVHSSHKFFVPSFDVFLSISSKDELENLPKSTEVEIKVSLFYQSSFQKYF